MSEQQKATKSIFINDEFEDIRVDRFLHKKTNLPYSMLFKFFRQGKVKCGKTKLKHNYTVKPHDEITCFFSIENQNQETKQKPKSSVDLTKYRDILFNNIVFDDKDYLVINKPSNIATQGGTGVKVSIDDLLKLYGKSVFLAHRLDKKTSGILVNAKNHKALTFLTNAFKTGEVNKTYLAIVQGLLAKKEGTINAPLIKSNNSKRQLVVVDEKRGKQAITDYTLLASSKRGNFHLLELKPHTGRTHQIRVHLAKVLNTPIVGDFKYGYEDKSELFKEQKDIFAKDSLFLHSYDLNFMNYNDDFCSFKAELDTKWVNALTYFKMHHNLF